jgi:DNA-binding transcriptional MerR regulator
VSRAKPAPRRAKAAAPRRTVRRGAAAARAPAKPAPASEAKLYRPISEVADVVGVKPHVLRYWETQFSMLRPRKNRAGNRMYRPEEVKLLARIKELLYDRRFTIAGARSHLLTQRKEPAARPPEAAANETERKLVLHEVKAGLRQILGRLRGPDGES